ncbi:MAG: hypothetical protein IT290_01780 [Deltaproteobacteria bacterium]|nr:hypothetical protein [Deltaproteobacteria bacterium]
MNRRSFAATLLFALVLCCLPVFASVAEQLEASLVLPTDVDADAPSSGFLRITNTGSANVRVSVRCQQLSLLHSEGMVVNLAPDRWKSLRRPPRRALRSGIVELRPGEYREIPFRIPAFQKKVFRISAEYEVGEQFAGEFKVWRGRVAAPDVEISRP